MCRQAEATYLLFTLLAAWLAYIQHSSPTDTASMASVSPYKKAASEDVSGKSSWISQRTRKTPNGRCMQVL
jgi:hypothetical protein